ncbi:MAG: hypothetical protein WC889_05480 [Myxococcota bacterium]|jgi:hypothetical protein
MMGKAMILLVAIAIFAGCASEGSSPDAGPGGAYAAIKNDFDNPAFPYQPKWTICHAYYGGQSFDLIERGATSIEKPVNPGLDYVLMVAAWDDPTCAVANCLPIATKNEEEIVSGQHRVIAINMPNHQGPCPPEGTQPIPQTLYDRILKLWPDYNFKPYADRTQNPQCLE